MKKSHIILLLASIAIIGFFLRNHYKKAYQKDTKEIHYHAGFEIYKDGKLMNFSELEYMNVKPCEKNDEEASETHTQPEVHLHDGIGNIVHIHGKEAQWKDLTDKLHLDGATASAYINKKATDSFQHQTIKPYDQAVIFINTRDKRDEKVSDSLSRFPVSYIKEIEKKSENCSTQP